MFPMEDVCNINYWKYWISLLQTGAAGTELHYSVLIGWAVYGKAAIYHYILRLISESVFYLSLS
jgi:hypothetical protein